MCYAVKKLKKDPSLLFKCMETGNWATAWKNGSEDKETNYECLHFRLSVPKQVSKVWIPPNSMTSCFRRASARISWSRHFRFDSEGGSDVPGSRPDPEGPGLRRADPNVLAREPRLHDRHRVWVWASWPQTPCAGLTTLMFWTKVTDVGYLGH